MYPSHLIDKVINRSISGKLVPGGVDTSSNQDRSNTFYFQIAVYWWLFVFHSKAASPFG